MLIPRQKQNLMKLLQRYSFQHLRCPPEVKQIQIKQDQIFRQMLNGQKKRHIFWGVQYTQKQKQAIKQVSSHLQQNNIFEDFPQEIILKHLYSAKFDIEQTLQRLYLLQQFHRNKSITRIGPQTISRLQSGCIYFYGHDKQMYPLLIVRPDKFKMIKKNQQQMLENFNCVYYCMLLLMNYRMNPYHNQKYVTIMDFNDMDISDIPFTILFQIFKRMHLYYCNNSQRAFLYNSHGIQTLWNVARKILPAQSFQNIYFIQKGKQHQMLQYVSQFQLQKKYGGSLQNLQSFWPPKSTNQSFDKVQMTQISQDTAFYSVCNDHVIFQDTSVISCNQNCNCSVY